MSYIDGFVIAVPTADKQKFIDHAKLGDSVFIDLGATRVLECWGDDVPDGKLTDFRMAVKARDDETVVFSWIEWPDKATRDRAHAKMHDWMNNPDRGDPRMDPVKNPMPFDGKRMIFGGFAPLLELPGPITRPAAAPAATVQPYLFFRGRCEEAIEYYKSRLGAEVVMMMRFSDNPDRPPREKVPAEVDDRIMHAALRIRGVEILMSDGMKSGPLDFQCMSLSLSVQSEIEADQIYHALAADGAVQMPIGPTFFAKRFGAVADKFGVSWMIMVPPDTGNYPKLTISTTTSASIESAWQAFTTPADITRWNFASDDWSCPHAEVDLRVGGRYRARMEAKDKSFGFHFEAVYEEIVPFGAITLRMSDGRAARTTFAAVGGQTKVTTVFDAEAQNSLELQRSGWQSILENFRRHIER